MEKFLQTSLFFIKFCVAPIEIHAGVGFFHCGNFGVPSGATQDLEGSDLARVNDSI